MSDEKKSAAETLARELIAGELLAIRKRWSKVAEEQRDAGLEAVAEVAVEVAVEAAYLFRQLTGRLPGEVD